MCVTRRISARRRALPFTASLAGFITRRPLNCGLMRRSLSFQPCAQKCASRRGFMKNSFFNSHRTAGQGEGFSFRRREYCTLMNMLVAGVLLSAGLPAHAMQQQRFNPDTRAFASVQTAPNNVSCNVNPASISARQPTNVNISLAANSNANTTARMAAVAPATLFLGRSAGSRYVALGAFTPRQQQQGIAYNITVTMNEPEPTTIQFAVS